jgi:hypothetical protein
MLTVFIFEFSCSILVAIIMPLYVLGPTDGGA